MSNAFTGVTPDHRAHYLEHGWVRLDGVLSLSEVERMRSAAEEIARADAAGDDPRHRDQLEIDFLPHRRSDTIRELATTPRIGGVLAELCGFSGGARLFRDAVFVKPATPGGTAGTAYHQDFPAWPLDRSTGATIWIALTDLPANSGTLRFVEGSHRRGVLGQHALDHSLMTDFPEDEALLSPMQALPAGSATVHNFLTIHGSSPNESPVVRIGYAASYMDPATRYTGAPHFSTEGLGLRQFEPLANDAFPLLLPA